jgi:hypothetical protein
MSGCVVGRHPPEITILEPIAVALERDDLGVVDEPVDHRRGDRRIAEHLTPAPERLVAGDDHRRPLVAGRHELEEEVGGLGLERDVADLVDDQQRIAAEPDEFGLEPARGMGLGQASDPLGRGREGDPVAGLAGPDRQPDREMGLSGPRGSSGP